MKSKGKREITRNRAKSSPLKSSEKNCYTVEQLIRMGNFDWLCIAEGYFLEGVRLGKWQSLNGMFKVINSCGITYCRASYYLFRKGQFYYVPTPFFSVCSTLVGVPVAVAASAGLASALSIALRHPDRWVIPSYVLDRGSVAS